MASIGLDSTEDLTLIQRNIHINELVRRLRNCSPYMEWGEKKKFIQDYVVRLFHAGYTEHFRQDIHS